MPLFELIRKSCKCQHWPQQTNLFFLKSRKSKNPWVYGHKKVRTLLRHLSSFKYSKYKHRALTKQVKNASQHFFFNKTKKVNSYNGLQIKFSDCAFKTKKKKSLKNSALQNKNQTSLSGTSES